MAQDLSEHSRSNENVLVSDNESATTAVYLDDENRLTSSTTISDANVLNDANRAVNNQSDKTEYAVLNYVTTTPKPRPSTDRHLSRDEWLAKEYFSYLCGNVSSVFIRETTL